PRHQLDAQFAPQLLQTLAVPPAQPVRSVAAPPPVWAGWAAAAAVLFLVGTGSYLYFANVLSEERPEIACAPRSGEVNSMPSLDREADPERLAVLPAEKESEPPLGAGPGASGAAEPSRPSTPPASASHRGDVLTSPRPNLEKLKQVPDRGIPVQVR